MTSVFPTGLPYATGFYLTLYVLTFALHWALMHYVAAGCGWLAWATLDEAVLGGNTWRRPVARTLLSWLPFMLSAAVTAGVAPLLFMQILYGVPFYTANLLLNWVWMLIIPALIALFYLFYLLQAWRDKEGSAWLRVLLAFVALGCVLLVGGLWSTNHLIANSPLARWTELYVGEASPFDWPSILARGGVWLGFSLPGMAMVAGWQLWGEESQPQENSEEHASSARPLAIAAVLGVALVCMGSGAVCWQLLPAARETIGGPFALPYVVALGIGLTVQAAAWIWQAVTGRLAALPLALASGGYVVALVSVAVVREVIRLAALGYEQFQAIHEQAAAIDGFTAFLVFALLNGGLIALCVWLVVRNVGEKAA